MNKLKNYITPNFSFAPMIPDHAKGSYVWDDEGNQYLDIAGGIAVNALGHCHPDLIKALRVQSEKLWHISNIYTTEPTQNLAEKLTKATFADKAFFCNSGAEANEAALKLARKFARENFNDQKTQIITCKNAFHGRTLFTVSVGGQAKYSQDFAPLPPDITHIAYNNIDELKKHISERTCAVIIEPIQGESGVLPANKAFLEEARKLCDETGALLIFDEVQTGMGRTGYLFAYQYFDIIPDILTNAKALGNGFPIGVMLTTDKIAKSFTPGSHGSTFGGNPLACAVGNVAFDIINQPQTLKNVINKGLKIIDELRSIATETGFFSEIRGIGMLIGCVLSDKYRGQASNFMKHALNQKLLILTAGDSVVRIAPSLLISDEEIKEAVEKIKATILSLI